MGIKRGRFDEMSTEEAVTLLRELEGPLLEMILSKHPNETAACDVPCIVLWAMWDHPVLQAVFPTGDEFLAWEVFRQQRGEGASEIAEFVYGALQIPWDRK
jgi:hypothetical protein